jgi:hypothetical protein
LFPLLDPFFLLMRSLRVRHLFNPFSKTF